MVVVEERHWLTGVIRLEDPRVPVLAEYIPADFRVSRSMGRALATYVERRRYFTQRRRREVAKSLAEPLLRRFGFREDTSYDLLLCALYHRTFITDRTSDEPADGSPFAAPATGVVSPAPLATLSSEESL
jgi:hypothetical protein